MRIYQREKLKNLYDQAKAFEEKYESSAFKDTEAGHSALLKYTEMFELLTAENIINYGHFVYICRFHRYI